MQDLTEEEFYILSTLFTALFNGKFVVEFLEDEYAPEIIKKLIDIGYIEEGKSKGRLFNVPGHQITLDGHKAYLEKCKMISMKIYKKIDEFNERKKNEEMAKEADSGVDRRELPSDEYIRE